MTTPDKHILIRNNKTHDDLIGIIIYQERTCTKLGH